MASRRMNPAASRPQEPSHTNIWEPQTSHENGHLPTPNGTSTDNLDTSSKLPSSLKAPMDPTRSPASLALRAHLLGLILGLSILISLNAAQQANPLWRLPFFLSTLSLFHSLEYYTTALYNPEVATTAAFLLNNGRAYNIAHFLAFLECYLHQQYFSYTKILPGINTSDDKTGYRVGHSWLVAGFILLGIGQSVRTTAMVHAGRNFNHIVQSRRKDGHVLVTDGVYKLLRHPSYFGFFWWGLGTQIVLGNVVCLVGYAVVLWRFFRKRIEKEEEFLVGFFEEDYVRYRRRTRVWIPFIP